MSKFLVKLKANKEQLKTFDFKEKPKSKKKPVDKKASDKKQVDKKANDAKQSQGIVSASIDPILGNLPRTVKAAPIANTNGLDLDKTPCRKWREQPVNFQTFSGYTFSLNAWTSEFKEHELEKLNAQTSPESNPTALPSETGDVNWTEQNSEMPTSDVHSELPSEQ